MTLAEVGGRLPSYRQPPVNEVVIAVSFAHVPGLTTPVLSEFWRDHLAEAFPTSEEQPPYVPPIERFDTPDVTGDLSFMFAQVTPSPRLWFISKDGQELIQVQRNWFACNWRRVRPEDTYGRWPSRRAAFTRWFGEFTDFVRAAGLGEISVTQCEVTYVNQVLPGEVWSHHGELNKVLTIAGSSRGGFLPPAEQMRLACEYVIRDEDQVPVGRLHVTAEPAHRREDKQPIFVVNLTARGAPEGAGIEGAMAFLDRGRVWIVNAFADITTSEMQRSWGREDA